MVETLFRLEQYDDKKIRTLTHLYVPEENPVNKSFEIIFTLTRIVCLEVCLLLIVNCFVFC